MGSRRRGGCGKAAVSERGERTPVSELQELRVDAIHVPTNIRDTADEEADRELVESVRTHGVIEPLIVNPNPETSRLELVAGFRRLAAAREAGLERVPCRLMALTPQQVDEFRLVENIQRKDLSPLEEARAIQAYLERHGETQAQLGEKLGKSQAWVANRLRLLETPEAVQDFIRRGILSASAAQEVLRVKDVPEVLEEVQRRLNEHAGRDPVTVTAARKVVDDAIAAKGEYMSAPAFDVSGCEGCAKFHKQRYATYCLDKQCYAQKEREALRTRRAELVARVRAGEEVAVTDVTDAEALPRVLDVCPEDCERSAVVRRFGLDARVCLDPESDCRAARAKEQEERREELEAQREAEWQRRQAEREARERAEAEERRRYLERVEAYLREREVQKQLGLSRAETRLVCLALLSDWDARNWVGDVLDLDCHYHEIPQHLQQLSTRELTTLAVAYLLGHLHDEEAVRDLCRGIVGIEDMPEEPEEGGLQLDIGRLFVDHEDEGEGETPEASAAQPDEEPPTEQAAHEAEEGMECSGEGDSCSNTSCPSHHDYVPPDDADAAEDEAEPEPYTCPYTKNRVDAATCRECNDTVRLGGGGCCEYVIQAEAPHSCRACEDREGCQVAAAQGVA